MTPRSYAGVPLSLAHLCELDVPPPDLIELSAKAGFASVGLRTHAAAPGGMEYPLRTAAEQTEMRRRVAATGVLVLYIELISLTEATRAQDYRPMLEAGAAIGATRLAVAGNSSDFAAVADRLAEISELAAGYKIAVDLEFMPFRAVRSVADATGILRRANHPNAHMLVDSLHVFRSNSAPAELAALAPALIGTFQICDAPRTAPADLVTEARTHRLLPGRGELALRDVLDALPAETPIGVEVPLAGLFPGLAPVARMTELARITRTYLDNRSRT